MLISLAFVAPSDFVGAGQSLANQLMRDFVVGATEALRAPIDLNSHFSRTGCDTPTTDALCLPVDVENVICS